MILIGDYIPGKSKVKLTIELQNILCNLEGPVLPRLNSFSIRPKAGPNLFSEVLPKSNNHFVFALANNHIMDYGHAGLIATQGTLNQNGYKYCGAGKDLTDARKPIIVEDSGVKIGIISCCEAQFGVANNSQPGVAEFGPWIYQTICNLCETVDTIIVTCHAAVGDSPWPSPYIRELYHSFIDAGATVVHGHHSHVPQGYEEYGDGLIFYGMGNFAIDPEKWCEYPNGMWSLAAEIDFSSKPLNWRLLTLEIRHIPGLETIMIEESTKEEEAIHKEYLNLCNIPLSSPKLFEALWHEVALRTYYHYGAEYMRFSDSQQVSRRAQARLGLSMFKRAILNSSKTSRLHSQNDFLLWYHMFACESHRQMLATALGVLAGEINDLRTEETRRLADEMMPWSLNEILK